MILNIIGILAAISKVLADGYREKAYEGDTKAMNRMLAPMAYAASPINGDAQRYELAANGGDAQAQFATGWFLMTGTGVPVDEKKGLKWDSQGHLPQYNYYIADDYAPTTEPKDFIDTLKNKEK